MKRALILICAITFFTPIFFSRANDCLTNACVEVYTQNGQIVIEGRKGSGPSAHKVQPPKAKVSLKPLVQPTKRAKPKSVPPKPQAVRSKRPVVKKAVKPKVNTAATSLQDKIYELLPTAGIAYQPSFEPLVHVPVYLWCDVPTFITKKISIVGEIVDVRLYPTFIWHYGDGTIFITSKRGAAYPDGEIRHTYSKPGRYLIELITSWEGDFEVAGVRKPITGKIETVAVLPITIAAAPTRFMN